MKFFASFLLVVVSTSVAIALSETGYRIILLSDVPERFSYADTSQMEVFDRSHWLFDEETGYAYPPRRKIAHTAIHDGKVASCTLIDVINERGNIGPIEGDYDSADLKVLVFGDSWSAFNQNGLTWTDILQRKLEARTGKSVHVVNFGRDGYGILQMFDLAAREMPKWKPDLAVFAFITNDLARVRTWRAILEKDGIEDRIVTTLEPTRTPQLGNSYDTFLVHADATHEWCNAMRESGERDRVIDAIEAKYQRAQRVGGERPANIYTVGMSYLWNRVRHGDPFHDVPDRFDFPSLEIESYGDDARFMKALDVIRAQDSETIMFHMAIYPEVRDQQEYILNFREQALLESLKDTTEMDIVETLAHTSLPVERPERINSAPDNFHPSLWGMEFYANVFIEGLAARGLIDQKTE